MTPRTRTDPILAEIAARLGLTLAELIHPDKRHATAPARQQVWLDVRLELNWSTSQIGRRLNRDHSTIIYGCQIAASQRYGLPPKSHWPAIQRAALEAMFEEMAA